MKKYILILSLFINIILIGNIIHHKIRSEITGDHSTPRKNYTDRSDSTVTWSYNKYKTFAGREELYTKMPITPNDVVFVGNSLTENFPVTEYFNNLRVKNRGIAGNNTYDILNRIKQVSSKNPKIIFLMAGINDIAQNIPPDSTFANIDKIVSTIDTTHTKLYIQSILPVSDLNYMKKVIAYNIYLTRYTKSKNISFINLFPKFYNGVNIKPELTTDGIHLTGNGYSIWKETLQPYIN